MRGFTLVELVMVALIIGIMACMAIPRFANTFTRHRVEAAASRVVHDLGLAQRSARLTSSGRTVAFDVVADKYQLVGLADLDRPTVDYEVDLNELPYEVRIIAADFDGNAKITFDGYGMPDNGGTVVIGVGGHKATVTVDAESGRASAQ